MNYKKKIDLIITYLYFSLKLYRNLILYLYFNKNGTNKLEAIFKKKDIKSTFGKISFIKDS